MRAQDIVRERLANQHLASPQLEDPVEVVSQLGAVQAQDFPAAKWALGLRVQNASEASVDAAFDRGEILRTHVLRPTWHFVVPCDIRWLLQLTAPRVKAMMLSYTRRLGLDEDVVARSEAALAHALEGGQSLTRAEVGAALRTAGIDVTDGATIGQIVTQAELDGILCSGPRRGRLHTHMLLEERAAPVPPLTRDEALAELTWRYFSSHGPALVADCTWWSSLPAREINRGLELNQARLESQTVDGRLYWFRRQSASHRAPETVHLLPNYDEYTVAYRHRELYYDAERNWTGNTRMDVPFTNVILAAGQVAGRWRRVSGRPRLEHTWTIEPGPSEQERLASAEERYQRFFG